MKLDATYRSRLFFYILLAVLIGVWIRVVYSVYEYGEGDKTSLFESTSSQENKINLPDEGSVKQPAYKADFPDPFEPATSLLNRDKPIRTKISILKKEVVPVEIPALILKGVTGITATVNGVDDAIHFVKPGDSIGAVSILEVSQDLVKATVADTIFILKLKP